MSVFKDKHSVFVSHSLTVRLLGWLHSAVNTDKLADQVSWFDLMH